MTTMIDICENEYDVFLALPNVNGIGIGYKEINNIKTNQLCLRVMVIKKVSLDELNEDEVVPKIYKGFITDVVEVGEFRPQVDMTKYRPAPGGCQLNPAGTLTAGTFGCLVSNKSGSTLTTYILSNNHVLADTNSLPIGSIILQPAPPLTNIIANLSAYIPIDFSVGAQNIVDCAIAQVIDVSTVTNSIIDIGPPLGIASAVLGDFVQKRGRTTEYTTGTITAISATVNVSYGASGVATFIRQITATSMSDSGDSGSIVLDSSNRVIGLLFAGSVGQSTVMNDIRPVLKSFRARLV